MAFVETNRFLYLTTPLGENKLLLSGFRGQEAISRLFRFELDVVAENANPVDFDKLIGQKVSFGVLGGDDTLKPRDLHGIVVELSQGARGADLTKYHMVVAPDIWKLSCKFRSRIFQHITIPDLLKKLFTGFDAAYEIQGTFEPREYLVQYQESDLDFAMRLMEEEGIYYFFKHTSGAHKLVLANSPQSHPELVGGADVIYEVEEGGVREEERIASWRKAQRWGSGKYTLWDHHFELPHKKLDAEQIVMDTVQAGKISHKLKLSGNEDLEIYENPGRYAQRFDGIDRSGGEQPAELQKIFDDNQRVVGIRMQQTETPMIVIEGHGNHRQLTAGHKFNLQRHFNADGAYVLTGVTHEASEGSFQSHDESGNHYGNSFTCIPYALKFRPARVTRRPVIAGPQSALVVGPSGEEIFTDKYSRVKVQFHWDREGQNNADSSCWLRVATSWAGQKWGAIHIPRIGQEVIVSFLEGDPDRPLVTGSVYNADMMPPYDLPANKTQSGIKSRSSKGGGPANYNEIMFEDLKGSELIRLHAEKDQLVEVENDRTVKVHHDESITVEHDRTENVQNDETLTVQGKRKHYVQGEHQAQTDGDLHLTASQNQNEKIGMSYSRQVGMNVYDKTGMNYAMDAGMMVHLKAGMNAVIEAGLGLTIKASGGSIDINPAGVFIQGNLVFINSGAANIPGCGSSPTSPTAPGAKALEGLKPDNSAAVAAAADSMAKQMQQQAQQAVAMASNMVNTVGQQAFAGVNAVAAQAVAAAQQAGQMAAGAEKQVLAAVDNGVKQAQATVAGAVNQAQNMLNTGMNAVRTGVQQAVAQASGAVSQIESQAAAAAQAAAAQMQAAAQAAEAAAAQAAAAGQAALNQALQQGQQMLQQAQAMEQQAQQQLQGAAAQAQQLAGQAQQAGQQALNQASQQLSQAASQAEQTAQGAAQQAQAAANQLAQTASQAAAQGEQQIASAATQAQAAATQAAQAAQQTAAQAQQAAQQAGAQAQQMEQQTQQQMQQATQAAGQQVSQAAGQAQQQVQGAAQGATQSAQQAGQMTQQGAQQVTQQVGQSAGQAAQSTSNTANAAYQSAGNSVNQTSKNMQQGLKGLGV
jgi:type VI secretion system secreted protein VgrG